MEHVMAVLSGAAFGFALDKGKTNVPFVVSEQMEMRNMVMMRMFLSAAAASTVAMTVLHFFGIRKRDVRTSMALGFGKLGGYGGNIVGGVFLGMGMYLTGSCPGTLWSQIPLITTSSPSVGYVVLGGIFGTILFGYGQKHMKKKVPKFQDRGTVEGADFVPKSMSTEVTGLLFAGAIAGILYGVNIVFPWQEEVQKVLIADIHSVDTSPLKPSAQAWDPAISGIIVGLLQFPLHLSTVGALGMSSAFTFISANVAGLFDKKLETNSPYLFCNLRCKSAAAQLLIGFGVIAGTAASQYLSEYPAITTGSVPSEKGSSTGALAAFFGGSLLFIGARIQAGCTSGQGLTGLSSLSIASLLSVCGMFAGGMGLGLAWR